MLNLSPKVIEETRQRFCDDFYFACTGVLEYTFPTSWLDEKIHGEICDVLGDLSQTRVGIFVPRAWLKSTVLSVYYPIWRAMKDPNYTCLIILNTFTNATKKLRAIRQILQLNPLLRVLFPERMPDAQCQMSAEAICIPRDRALASSTFEAAGVGTQMTGRHVDDIIEDDTLAPEDDDMSGDVAEPRKEDVDQAIGLHKAIHFLLNDFQTGRRLIAGTRWLERDLCSHVKDNEPDYYLIERASKEDENGKPDDENGVVTYPSRFPQTVLDDIKHIVGQYMYSTLMQNTPMSPATRIFQDHMLVRYEHEPPELLCYTTVDPASREEKEITKSDPDYNVVLTTGINPKNGNIYILDYFRKRCNPGEVVGAIIDHVRRFTPLKVGIESVSYQNTLLYWTKEMMNKHKIWFIVEEIKRGRRNKDSFIHGLQPLFDQHRIHIKAWMSELINELLMYPKGAHDDIIDDLSMQLNFWRNTDIEREKVFQTGNARRTGAYFIEQLTARTKPKQGFPHDVMPAVLAGSDEDKYVNRYDTNFF